MIPEELIKQLRYIEIYTTRAVRNALVGDHLSSIRGHGFEFYEHKRYQQGDDYRQIDWNVTARMQYPYIKKSFEEKEINAIIAADLSKSMDFTTTNLTKKELLMQLTATIAFSAISDNISMGFLGFTDSVEEYIAPQKGRRQVWKILDRLWNLHLRNHGTNLESALDYLTKHLKKMSLIFFISDFISPENMFDSKHLKILSQKHDFIPIVLEDNLESMLPRSRGFLRIKDLENGQEMVVNLSSRNLAVYEQLMRKRKEDMGRVFYDLNLDHVFIQTGQSYLDSLLGFFLNRKRRRR